MAADHRDNTHPVQPGELRPGDRVRVRPAEEILATLDATGAYEGVPFMPEMTASIGGTFTVYKRLEKICDYFGEETRSRRMTGTVLLDDPRCSGGPHGGCQAECRIFWKEAWLEHVGADETASGNTPEHGEIDELEELLARNSQHVDPEGRVVYRCQATEAVAASSPIGELSLGQYVTEVRVGNVSPWTLLRVGSEAVARKIGRRLGFRGGLPRVAGQNRVDGETLDLQPGELVRVRSQDEIGRTLNDAGALRGLVFTIEMTPRCGKTYRVRRRVERLIDERTGVMRELKNDCISLEDVVCTGCRSPGAWLCPREHYPLWREAWLERVDPAGSGVTTSAAREPESG